MNYRQNSKFKKAVPALAHFSDNVRTFSNIYGDQDSPGFGKSHQKKAKVTTLAELDQYGELNEFEGVDQPIPYNDIFAN